MLNAGSRILPVTKGLAVCVLQGKIKSLEQIFLSIVGSQRGEALPEQELTWLS